MLSTNAISAISNSFPQKGHGSPLPILKHIEKEHNKEYINALFGDEDET